jgi:hypothetical protein
MKKLKIHYDKNLAGGYGDLFYILKVKKIIINGRITKNRKLYRIVFNIKDNKVFYNAMPL